MNGLEAVELMKQGKSVKMVGLDVVFKIENNNVKHINPINEVWDFQINGCYEEYIEPKALTGWERVERSNKYNFIDSCCAVESSCEMVCNVDNKRYELADYFSTKEKAEEINFKQTLFRKLQRFSDENGGNEIDWEDIFQRKFYICYRYDCKQLATYNTKQLKDFGIVYFVSEKIAEKAIELFHDDLIKYFKHDWN